MAPCAPVQIIKRIPEPGPRVVVVSSTAQAIEARERPDPAIVGIGEPKLRRDDPAALSRKQRVTTDLADQTQPLRRDDGEIAIELGG